MRMADPNRFNPCLHELAQRTTASISCAAIPFWKEWRSSIGRDSSAPRSDAGSVRDIRSALWTQCLIDARFLARPRKPSVPRLSSVDPADGLPAGPSVLTRQQLDGLVGRREESPFELACRHWPAKEVALALFATHRCEKISGGAVLDTFGNDR